MNLRCITREPFELPADIVGKGIEIVKIYGLDGVIRETLGKGVNICILSDGTVIKVFSKD